MSLQKGFYLSDTDFNNIKDRIIQECSRRTTAFNNYYRDTFNPVPSIITINKNEFITAEYFNSILSILNNFNVFPGVNILNAIYQDGNVIVGDWVYPFDGILGIIKSLEDEIDKNNDDCNNGCMGLCTNSCANKCTNACTSCTGCSGGCNTGCSGCGDSCSYGADGSGGGGGDNCGACGTQCTASCYAEIMSAGYCTGGCSGTCTLSCSNAGKWPFYLTYLIDDKEKNKLIEKDQINKEKMKEIKIKISKDISNSVEKIFYEYNASLNIVAFLMRQETINEEYLNDYLKKSEEYYIELTKLKEYFMELYKPNGAIRYYYDFANNLIVYEIEDDS